MFAHQAKVVLVHQRRTSGTAEHAHGYRNKHQSGDTRGVPFALLVDDWKSDEEHVQQAVQHAHVYREEKDNWLDEQELEGPDKKDAQPLAQRTLIKLEFGNEFAVACLLTQLLCSSRENGRCIGLRYREGDQDVAGAGEYELDPIQPAPAHRVGQEAAD